MDVAHALAVLACVSALFSLVFAAPADVAAALLLAAASFSLVFALFSDVFAAVWLAFAASLAAIASSAIFRALSISMYFCPSQRYHLPVSSAMYIADKSPVAGSAALLAT